MTTFRTPDGATVRVVTLRLTSDCSNGQWYRVTDKHGNFHGKTQSLAGLAELGIDLATLEEEK